MKCIIKRHAPKNIFMIIDYYLLLWIISLNCCDIDKQFYCCNHRKNKKYFRDWIKAKLKKKRNLTCTYKIDWPYKYIPNWLQHIISPLYISIQIWKAIDILLVTGNLNLNYVLEVFLFARFRFDRKSREKCKSLITRIEGTVINSIVKESRITKDEMFT